MSAPAVLFSVALALIAGWFTVIVTQGQNAWVAQNSWLAPLLLASAAISFLFSVRWVRHRTRLMYGFARNHLRSPVVLNIRAGVEQTGPAAFEDGQITTEQQSLLKYRSITGVPVTLHGEKYNAQIANIKNTQTATENTTNGAIAQIKYAPAVGRDSFVVKAATWYSIEGRDVIVEQTDVSFIPGGQVRSVLLLLIDSTNRVMIPTGVENPPVRELGIGHWTARLSITADNCDPLHGDIGFTILGDRKWDWDKPAFTLYHQKKSVVR